MQLHFHTCPPSPIEIDKRLVEKINLRLYKFMYLLQTISAGLQMHLNLRNERKRKVPRSKAHV